MIKYVKQNIYFLVAVLGVYCLYFFADMATSANTLVKQESSRGSVHIFLIILILFLTIYYLKKSSSLSKNISKAETPLFFLGGWMAFVDLITGSTFWNIAVRVGLIIFWALTLFFASNYITCRKRFQVFLNFEIFIWVFTMYFAISSFYNFAEYRGEDTENVLNISYNILVLLPILLMYSKKRIRNLIIVISCIFIIISMKRGAIITMTLMLFSYYYVDGKVKGTAINFSKIIVLLIIILVSFFFVNEYTDGYLASRFSISELQSGSNRDILREKALADILDRDIFSFFIGKGSSGVLRILENGVHNEFLDILFSYGLIGMIIYTVLLINMYRKLIKLIKKGSSSSSIYAMCFIYVLFVGIFGTALFAHYTFHIMMAIGVSVNYINNREYFKLFENE